MANLIGSSTSYLTLPPEKLSRVSKIDHNIVPDLEALYDHFAPSIADEIKRNNQAGNPAALPPMAVTPGMGGIWRSRRIRLYCQGGSWQRTVLRIALMGEPQVDYPVTLLQGHPDYAIITDQGTAQAPFPKLDT